MSAAQGSTVEIFRGEIYHGDNSRGALRGAFRGEIFHGKIFRDQFYVEKFSVVNKMAFHGKFLAGYFRG